MEESSNAASTTFHNGSGDGVKAVGESGQSVTREFQNFVTDVEDLVKSGTNLSGEALERVKEQILKRIATARKSVGSAAQVVIQRGRRTATATHEFVTEEPWKAVGIGTAIGLLVGLLISRR